MLRSKLIHVVIAISLACGVSLIRHVDDHINILSTLQAQNIHATGNVTIDGGALLYQTLSGTTSSITKVDVSMLGTVDTTAGNLTYAAVSGQADITKIAGAGTVNVTGIYGRASGTGVNLFAGLFDGPLQVNGTQLVTGRSVLFGSPIAQSYHGGSLMDSGAPAGLSGCGGAGLANGTGQFSGFVTEGAGATGCVVTFANDLPGSSQPSCTVTSRDGTVPVSYVPTANELTVTNAVPITFDFDCWGH